MKTSYYQNFRTEMMSLIAGEPKRILEIGCGAGNFRKNFPYSNEYWGVEPYPKAAEKAKANLTKVFNCLYDDCAAEIPTKTFDLIVCNDVIEHMVDPRGFLRSIKEKISSSGQLILSIPNFRNIVTLYDIIVRGRCDYADSGVLDYTHLHIFTIKSFCAMATECGWEIETINPINRQPLKTLNRLIVKATEVLIPEIGYLQFAARIRPSP